MNGNNYLWMAKQSHALLAGMSPAYRVAIEVKVFLDGFKTSPLNASWVLPFTSEHKQITPSAVRRIIEKGLAEGWEPEKAPFSLNAIVEELE